MNLDRNGYSASILQDDPIPHCFLCGRSGYVKLDRHEVFGGAYRQKSKRLGLWVLLCHHECHLFGPHSAHQDAATAMTLKRLAQRAAMLRYTWSVADFRLEFGKNYLEEDDGC